MSLTDLVDPLQFEAVIQIDQACATNTAFRESVQPTPAVPEVILSEELLPPTSLDF